MSTTRNSKIVAIILMVVGAALIAWGYQMADSIGNQLSESLTGAATDDVMTRYIAGAASLAVGIYLFFRR